MLRGRLIAAELRDPLFLIDDGTGKGFRWTVKVAGRTAETVAFPDTAYVPPKVLNAFPVARTSCSGYTTVGKEDCAALLAASGGTTPTKAKECEDLGAGCSITRHTFEADGVPVGGGKFIVVGENFGETGETPVNLFLQAHGRSTRTCCAHAPTLLHADAENQRIHRVRIFVLHAALRSDVEKRAVRIRSCASTWLLSRVQGPTATHVRSCASACVIEQASVRGPRRDSRLFRRPHSVLGGD